jgi:hypothetical protein
VTDENPREDTDEITESASSDVGETGEVILSPGTDELPPDITGEDAAQVLDEAQARETLYPPRQPRRKGNVTFGGDQERVQAQELGDQMTRSIEHQLQTASEHIQHISWIETDASRNNVKENPNDLDISRFEMILSNGKVYTIEGPLMHLHIQN